MEFAARTTSFTHKRFFLPEFLHELSDELYLLVSFAKRTSFHGLFLSGKLCLFLYNSDSDYSADPIE